MWYDEHDMGINIQQSMIDGIKNSKVVLVCLDQTYQTRANCLFELEEAFKAENDPSVDVTIVALVIDKDIFSWANDEIKNKCNLQYKMFLDISKVYEPDDGRWDKSSWEGNIEPTKEMKSELGAEVGKLVVRLRQLNCHPSS